MHEHRYNGRVILLQSYEEKGVWFPEAMILEETHTGTV